MNILALSLFSIGLYCCGTIYQFLIYTRKLHAKPFISFFLGAAAVSAQLIATLHHVFNHDQVNLGLVNTASLTSCLIIICLLLLSTRKPLQIIFLAVYPFASLTVLGALLFQKQQTDFSPVDSGIFIHIILSILAYSVFSIAAVQAILVQMQNKNLKRKNNTILMRNLPPLLAMENLLFEMLWSGTILLTIAIVAGFIFVEDLFAQHLVHKTVLSLIALGIFSVLLAGRKLHGWRGLTASKWTLWGGATLMLAFFGSKFVLEWLL